MNPPAGTFLARVSDGAVHLPPPLKAFCETNCWTLFRIHHRDRNVLEMHPVLPQDPSQDDDFHSSLSAGGRLWIPAPLRAMVGLGEQSVMLRVENGVIHVYLRKVFETLGFGP